MEDAETIFHGLTSSVNQSFESVDKAYGYLSRARREVEAAHRRAEESRSSLNTAVGQFSQRMREMQLRFDPDGVSNVAAPRMADTPSAEASGDPIIDVHQEPRAQSPPIGDEDYAEPHPDYENPQPISLSELFSPRRDDETDAAYENRLDVQRRWLDAQGVFQARREREARANAAWENINAGRRHYTVPTSEPSGGPPDDGGDNGDPGRNRDHRRNVHHPRPPPPVRGGFGRGRGGDPPGGGPPGGEPGDDDDETSSSSSTDEERDELDDREPSLRAPHRNHTRSPSYMPERPRRDASDIRLPRAHVDVYRPETNDAFMRESMKRLRQMIRDKLGEQLPENAALKNVKNLPTPDKYGGEDDIELFEGWFKALLRWLRFMRLGGPALDEERMQIMGLFLKGKAFDWYNDTIDSSLVRGPPWKFAEAVCAMFERFLHHANAGIAADKFYSVTYAKETGVHGLWDTLVKYAARMPQAPDDYTFARKFAAALPPDVGVPLFRNKNVTIEGTTPRVLYDMAVQQEHNNKQADFYRSKVSSSRPNPSTQPAASTAGPSGNSRSGSDRRPDAPARSFGQGSRPVQPFVRVMKRAEYDAQRKSGGNSTSTRSGISTDHASPGGRDGNRPESTTSTFNASRPANAGTSHKNPSVRVRDKGCFNCGELGHFSKDCPHPQQAKFHAARVLDTTEDTTPTMARDTTSLAPGTDGQSGSSTTEGHDVVSTEALNEEYHDALDGSQYDSEGNNAPIEEYLADDEELIFFGGMYRRSDTFTDRSEDYTPEEPNLYDQLRRILNAQPNSADYIDDFDVRSYLRDMVSEPICMPGVAASADPEAHAAFIQSGMSAAAWELTELLQHLRTEPGTPYYVDNVVVRRMIRQLLLETEAADGPSTSTTTDPRQATRDQLQETVDGLRIMVGQVHGDLGTLHRELLWTRLELVNVLGRLREQHDHHSQLYEAVTDLVGSPEPITTQAVWLLVRDAIQRFHPRPISPLFPRIQERLARQDDMFEDMAVNSDSEGEYIDDPSPAAIRARIRALFTNAPSENGNSVASEGNNSDIYADMPPLVPNDDQTQMFALRTMEERPPVVTRATVRRPLTVGRRPAVTPASRTCLTAYVTIHGLSALVLLDSGSTTDSLSPDFARVARVPVVELENPAVLHLGCVGSRSRISHGTTAPVLWGTFSGDVYFDIVNLDRYDAVLGTPFMRRFGVCLDFGANVVRMGSQTLPALAPKEEEAAVGRKRNVSLRTTTAQPSSKAPSGVPRPAPQQN